MKYRTKLYLIFCALVFGSVLLIAGLAYYEAKERMIEHLSSEALSIASTSAVFLDQNSIETLKISLDDQSPEFQTLVRQMREVRNANRIQKTDVQYIYLIEPDPKNPHQIIVLADSAKGADYAPPGTAYPEGVSIGILNHLNEPFAPNKLVSDRWSQFLAGYAPVISSNGKYLATIGVNLSFAFYQQDLNQLKWIALGSMGIALAAGLIAATLLSRGITHSLNRICAGVARIGSGELQTRIRVLTEDEFGELASSINLMAVGLQERERLELNFVRYVSKHILEKIMEEGRMPALEGEKKKVTVLFSDIRHFSELAEKLSPEQVVSVLNEFLSTMIDVIFERNGTLDKFIGDGLMIEFGAPLEDPEQEKHAVETAIAMQKALHKLNESFVERNLPEMEMVIGIHSGPAILGNIGSEKRMEYTAIGDTVNTTSRIEEAAKKMETPILISETTWMPIRDLFQSQDLGELQLRGKTQAIKVYSIKY